MPRVEATAIVPLSAELAFQLSQAQGDLRYRWDRFVRAQEWLDGATEPARGVRTRTRSRHGLVMVSEYVSVSPPHNVGMRMVSGPWFFRTFAGGWHFTDHGDGSCTATWRYRFETQPRFVALLADPIGRWVLQRDLDRRLAGFVAGCGDPEVLAALAALDEAADT